MDRGRNAIATAGIVTAQPLGVYIALEAPKVARQATRPPVRVHLSPADWRRLQERAAAACEDLAEYIRAGDRAIARRQGLLHAEGR